MTHEFDSESPESILRALLDVAGTPELLDYAIELTRSESKVAPDVGSVVSRLQTLRDEIIAEAAKPRKA